MVYIASLSLLLSVSLTAVSALPKNEKAAARRVTALCNLTPENAGDRSCGACKKISPDARTCTSDDALTSCLPGQLALTGSSCVTACPVGFYADANRQTCLPSPSCALTEYIDTETNPRTCKTCPANADCATGKPVCRASYLPDAAGGCKPSTQCIEGAQYLTVPGTGVATCEDCPDGATCSADVITCPTYKTVDSSTGAVKCVDQCNKGYSPLGDTCACSGREVAESTGTFCYVCPDLDQFKIYANQPDCYNCGYSIDNSEQCFYDTESQKVSAIRCQTGFALQQPNAVQYPNLYQCCQDGYSLLQVDPIALPDNYKCCPVGYVVERQGEYNFECVPAS